MPHKTAHDFDQDLAGRTNQEIPNPKIQIPKPKPRSNPPGIWSLGLGIWDFS
jgi:hypothetical protein